MDRHADMNIGFFSNSYPGLTGEGGIGTHTRQLAHSLTAAGHDVHVLTPGKAAGETRDGAVRIHFCRDEYIPIADRFVPGIGANCRIATAMTRLVHRHRLDLVEFPNWGGVGVGYALARPAPLVVRLYTSAAETNQIDGVENARTAAWDIRRERWLARSADALVTHSDAHRRNISRELVLDADQIELVPLGLPTAPWYVRPERPPSTGDDAMTVVYLGRMEARKGTLDLIRAIPGVLREVPNVHFTLIGADRPHCPGGRTHAQYIEETLPPEIRERIHLAGRLPDSEVDRLVQSADLFVAPSLYESFGLIFVEAMRWGTPVVGTKVGGIPEIVEDGQSGVLVPPGSPDELGTVLVSLLRDEPLRRRLGESGRIRVEREFSAEQMAQRSIAFYARVCENQR